MSSDRRTSDRRTEQLPVFPLTGTLLLPGTYLPLNIFEPRYLNMVRDALEGEGVIGMIQPEVPGPDNLGMEVPGDSDPKLYPVGCMGTITRHKLQEDGRCHIVLEGVSRFRVVRELEPMRGYRRVEADLEEFDIDLGSGESSVDVEAVRAVLGPYARRKGLEVDGDLLETLSADRLVSVLSTALPFSPAEKQALLEARSTDDRAELLMTLMGIEIDSTAPSQQTVN